MDDFDIRPCRDGDEMSAYARVVQYVFADDAESVNAEMATTLPEWTTCAFERSGRLVATMAAFPFTVRLNGAPVSMGGVTAVGTLPEYRRRGLLRRMMTQGLATMRERGQPFAILIASMGAIYQRFGFGLASTRVRYAFDPRQVAFEHELPARGRVRLVERDEAMPLVRDVYVQWATPRNLALHRAGPLWDLGTYRPVKGREVYTAVYEAEPGTARGFAVYTTESRPTPAPGPDQVLTVRDFIGLDVEAERALWNYLRAHDLVATVEMVNCVGEDHPFPELLLEPRMLNRQTSDWLWMRVVDVEAGLAARPYSADGRLVIEVVDDTVCPWNAGRYELETTRGHAAVRRTGDDPDLVMPVNTLAGLLAGHRSATHYGRAGLLEARTDRALAGADAMFRTAFAPHCPNGF